MSFMTGSTSDQLLDVAERLFADRGFEGVSIAAIADELGLTKQALLHHFGNKAALYGAVIKRLSQNVEGLAQAGSGASAGAGSQLEQTFIALYRWSVHSPDGARLLMRELLDNNRRAAHVETWYLKPFVLTLAAQVKAARRPKRTRDEEALVRAYQLLGAISYFAVSKPTLIGILGRKDYQAMQAAFEPELVLRIKDVVHA